MKVGDVVKGTPTWILAVCGTILSLAVIASFVILAVTGSNAEEFTRFINTVMNAITVVFSGGAVVLAGSAARSSHNADKQTNGQLSELKAEIAALKGDSTERTDIV